MIFKTRCIICLLLFSAVLSCKKTNTKNPRIQSNVAGEYGNGTLTWWNGSVPNNSFDNSTRAAVTYIQTDSIRLTVETNAPVPSIKNFNLKLEYKFDSTSFSDYSYEYYKLDDYTTPFFSGHTINAVVTVYASQKDRLTFVYDSFYNGQRIQYAHATLYEK
jgi:hypothetical protein